MASHGRGSALLTVWFGNQSIDPPSKSGRPVLGIEDAYCIRFASRDAANGRPASSDGRQSYISAPLAEVQMQPRKHDQTLQH